MHREFQLAAALGEGRGGRRRPGRAAVDGRYQPRGRFGAAPGELKQSLLFQKAVAAISVRFWRSLPGRLW